MCNLCKGKTLITRIGSDTVMTMRIERNRLIVKATYSNSADAPSTSVMTVKINVCPDCGCRLEEE